VTRFFSTISPRWLLLLGTLLLLWRLDYASLWNPDEGRYASASLEMAYQYDGSPSDWVVPHLNSIPRLNKPPLVYWLGAASFRVFGVSTFSARLAPALAAVGVLFLLYFLGRRMFSERAGIAGALVWATALFPAAMGRTFNTDMLLTSTIALAMGGIWLAIEEESKAGKWRGCLLAGLGLGLALLAKGPVGLALPLLLCFAYLCLGKRWKRVPWVGVVTALVLALGLALPWFLLVEQQEPGFIHRFLFAENLGRFSGKEDYHDTTPFYFYLPVIILGLVPWTAFILPTCVRGVLRDDDNSRRARLYLWIWGGLLVAFFSVSSTKLVSYVLPAFPAFCLLVGEALGGIPAADKRGEWPQKIRWIVLGIALLLNCALLIGATIYLWNDKTIPRSEATPYVATIAVVLIGGSVALVLAWLTQNRWRIFVSQSITAVAMLLTLLHLAGHISFYEDASEMFTALKPHLRPEDKVVEYRTFQPTAIFYLQRPIPIYNFRNNSGLDETDASFKQIYRTEAAFKEVWTWPERTFVLMRWNHQSKLEIPKPWRVIAQNNDYRLISNRPAPAGFQFDFTAPKKRNRIQPPPNPKDESSTDLTATP
jgi:4-amino-4-deoxy-L-arabinose transferase-like glycosyltransferase